LVFYKTNGKNTSFQRYFKANILILEGKGTNSVL